MLLPIKPKPPDDTEKIIVIRNLNEFGSTGQAKYFAVKWQSNQNPYCEIWQELNIKPPLLQREAIPIKKGLDWFWRLP